MAKPKNIRWKIQLHTKTKHAILREYLKAWFPILARWNRRIIYYDGFSGSGGYSGGEEGSPLIALNVAQDCNLPNTEIVFVFVESNKKRAESLRKSIEQEKWPNNFRYEVYDGESENVLSNILDYLEKEDFRIAPTFAFIDPFGVKGASFSIVKRLLENPKCEVLITFMTGTIRRFVTETPISRYTNELIGNSSAAEIIQTSDDKVSKARELYQKSLREVAEFVRSFEMKSVTIYDLFFATNHPLGHEKMKEAMWKVDESGGFRYSDRIDPNQLELCLYHPEKDLAEKLSGEFQGRTVTSEDIFNYVSEGPTFIKRHARGALQLLEDDNKIQVEGKKKDGIKRRRGTFAKGTIIIFHKGD